MEQQPVNMQRREYREVNAEAIAEYQHEWYMLNRDKVLALQKEYRQNNPDKEKARHKKFRKENCVKYSLVHQCYCGGSFILSHKAKHERTQKHITAIPPITS